MDARASLNACMDTLQALDHDRYLACLFAKKEDQLSLFALHALNAELGKVRESVSEPMLGEIRLTWWREAVEELPAGKVRKHPVVEALAAPVQAGLIKVDALHEMIEARIADLYEEAPRDAAALDAYAAQTGGILLQECLRHSGSSDASLAAAKVVGTAMSKGGVVRAIAFHASMRRIHLPADALEAIGLRPEQIFQGEFTPAIATMARDMGQNAMEDLCTALRQSWSKRERRALAAAIFSLCDLRKAQTLGFDPAAPQNAAMKSTKIAKTWWFIQTGHI